MTTRERDKADRLAVWSVFGTDDLPDFHEWTVERWQAVDLTADTIRRLAD